MADNKRDLDEHTLTKDREETQTPRLFKVLLHNDDYTTMDFVVEVLKRVFRKTQPEAMHIMLSVHHKGTGIAGVYSREVAEMKINQVHSLAREHEHPLRCSMERE